MDPTCAVLNSQSEPAAYLWPAKKHDNRCGN